MRQAVIEQLLFSQLAEAEQPDLFSYKFNRRKFILGASLLLSPASALASQIGSPKVDRYDSVLRVTFNGFSWNLDPRQFGSSAQTFVEKSYGKTRFGLRSAYFPGTNIRADFEAALEQAVLEWKIVFKMSEFRLEAVEPLSKWMSGQPLSDNVRGRKISLGSQTLRFRGGLVNINSQNGLTLTLNGEKMHISGTLPCQTDSVTITPGFQGDAQSLVEAASVDAENYSRISIDKPYLEENTFIKLSSSGASLKPERIESISVEVFESSSGRQAILLVEGAGTYSPLHASDSLDNLILKQAVALFSPNGNSIVGRPEGGQIVQLGNAALQLHASGGPELVAHFEGGRQLGASRPLSVAGIRLPSVHTSAQLLFPEDSPSLIDAISLAGNQDVSSTQVTSNSSTESSRENYLRIEDISDHRERILDDTYSPEGDDDLPISLDNATIELRRGEDLLNLRFRFVGYELRRWRRYSPYLKLVAPIEEARIVVEFQPQHIWETVHQKPADCVPPADYSDSAMSERSRIVFQPKQDSWDYVRLTLDKLLDWDDLELVVDDRAKQARQNGVVDHIEKFLFPDYVDGTPITTDDLFNAITSKIAEPSPEVTALRLADRLVFSPAERSASFVLRDFDQGQESFVPITFAQQVKGSSSATPLWNVRLDELGRKSVRAIWSDYLLVNQFTHGTESDTRDRALNALNSREIVAQTSLYGMPALRRIDRTENEVSNRNLAAELSKIPRTEVIRPDNSDYEFLEDSATFGAPSDIGIAIPSTFDDADITLTSLGAMLDARWERDPARLKPAPGPNPAPNRPPLGFGLEQFAYETALGRDIRVLAVRKGFLFPLGVRASFTCLVERYLFPDPTTPDGVVSYEMVRYFIECRQDPKSFPSLNQPYSAHDFPTSSITLRTKQTPDLVDPAYEDPNGDVDKKYSISRLLKEKFPNLNIDPDAHIFWPRELGSDGSIFEFQWQTDSGAAVSSPLLWVDNIYVGSAPIMKALVKDYYNQLDEGGLRSARFFGAKQRYANESEEGETQFDTHSWELKARGQLLPSVDGEEVFTMDGRMEGADQPPFYPWMDKGKIVIQSLDRMLGKPQGLITVQYHDPYRRLGFDSPDHQSEIYLKVLAPAIKLDVSANSNTTGGLASPNSLVAALSRKSGIVGGKARTGTNNTQEASFVTSARVTDRDSGFDFTEADLNKFSPAEFFGLGEAKLLGILSLQDVIAATADLSDAPRLVEKIGYGAIEDNGGLDRIKIAANTAAGISANFFSKIGEIDGELQESPLDMGLSELYPTLYRRIVDAQEPVTGIKASFDEVAAAKTLPATFDASQRIIKLARPLIRELKMVLRNPLPPIADDIIDSFEELINVLGGGLQDSWKNFANTALEQFKASLTDEICEIFSSSPLASTLLGVSQATQCEDLIRDPRGLAQALGKSLVEEQFAHPLAKLFETLADIQTMVDEKVMFAHEALRSRAFDLIDSAVSQVQQYLDQTTQPDDIRNINSKIEFARETVKIAEDLLSEVNNNPDQVVAHFTNEFRTRLESRYTELLSYKIHLRDPSPISKEEVLARIIDRTLPELNDTAILAVVSEVQRARRLIKAFKRSTPEQHLRRIGEMAFDALIELLKVQEFSRIAQVASQVNDWCNKVIQVTKEFAVDLFPALGGVQVLLDLVVTTTRAVNLNVITVPELADAARGARRQMLQLIEELRSKAHQVDRLVQNLNDVDSCADISTFLDNARKLSFARSKFIQQTAGVMSSFAELAWITRQVGVAELQEQMEQVFTEAKSLVIESVGLDPASLEPVHRAIDELASQLDAAEAYRSELKVQAQYVEDEARHIHSQIQSLTSSNIDRINDALVTYGEEALERTLSLILQSVALDAQQIRDWMNAAAEATVVSAELVNIVHEPLADGMSVLQAELERAELASFLEFVIGDAAYEELQNSFTKVAADRTIINNIASGQFPVANARLLLNSWSNQKPAVVALGEDLAGYASDFLSGKIPEQVLFNLKNILNEYKDQLEDFILQLIPTSINTGYNWDTKIEDGEIFAMQRKDNPDQEADLSLSVNASIDILRDKRSMVTRGKLRPFKLTLMPDAHMATIFFEPLIFESINGASPRFDVKIQDVEIGPMLSFIEALKDWMSPSGNGFYVRPTIGGSKGPGIEAGFQFGTDLIQVGSLAFQNIYLRVAAWLPFTHTAAQFTFAFASPDRPFLISSPPYGGGGHVALIAEPGGRTDLDLAFIFGAVTAIKFGPLSGNGRIVVGFGVRTWNGGQTLKALFEAVGEGSIACFSISVSLRVVAYHYSSGDMYGSATFKFKFKMGFLKYSYRVRAKYREGNGGGAQAVPNAAQLDSTYSYETTTKAMNIDYKSNQSHVDLSLI